MSFHKGCPKLSAYKSCNNMSADSIVRKPEFDILKGLLIVTVVMGHTSFKIPLIDVYWFHMPAFFMITG